MCRSARSRVHESQKTETLDAYVAEAVASS